MTRGLLHLASAAVALVLPTLAPANCFPPKSFSQIGLQFSQYVLAPETAQATPGSVVGRFWQPGIRVSTNEGTCDETKWLTRCYDCNLPHPGPVYYIDGVLGQMPCFSGCPSEDMIVLVQDRVPYGGGLFAVGRVDEIPGGVPRFDFSRIDTDWTLAPIPRPHITLSEVQGSTLHLDMTFDDPAPGYFGLPNADPTETITAIYLLTFEGAAPPIHRASWTLVKGFTYLGGMTTGSVNIFSACPGNSEAIRFVATALELDGGQFVTDYVSDAVPVSCTAEVPAGAGHLPETGTGALTVRRSPAGELTLDWGAACASPAYEVYEGVLGNWIDTVPMTCAVTSPTWTFPEPLHDAYYLVVPYTNSASAPQVEGSYGLKSDGSERAQSPSACRSQWIVPCP